MSEPAPKSVDLKQEICVVPWYNASQFRKVYECLYSPELSKKRWALDQISVWETRCHPSLPAAIEATYGLASAIVQDILWTNHTSLNQQLDIQYIYSSAITRFVNLTIEIHETPGTNMAVMAKGIGIPSYIIDLRNEASHSFRPSLSCLRIAAEAAMKYLKESYWDKEAAIVKNLVKKPVDAGDIKKLIQDYASYELRMIYKEQKRATEQNCKVIEELEKKLKKIESHIKNDKKLFIKVLSEDGIFIPHDDDFKLMVSEEDFLQFQDEYDEDPSKYPLHFDIGIIPKLPSIYEKVWSGVIALLNAYDAVPMFMESLLKSQADRTVIGQKLIISFVLTILRIHSLGSRCEKSTLRKVFKRKGIVVNWHSMFYSAVANPCKYTAFVFPLIFCNLDLQRKVTQRILNLVAIYLGQTRDDSFYLLENSNIFTVEQLKQTKMLQKAEREKMKGKSKNSIWSLVSDDSYKTWPIGCIINPVKQEENEQLEEDSCDAFDMADLTEKFILINNENDHEEHFIMDVESPDTFQNDVREEIKKRKSFLYKK